MKKILVIEDDTTMRENTAEILELAHYKVTTASNGRVGCAMAKEQLPDLVVCDIMMPELDGYGVLHVLSKDPRTASIPFIFLSAKAEKSEVRKGMELGADDYLTKPFEDTDLLNAIEARLRKAEAIRREYSRDEAGFQLFLEEAGGLKELQGLSRGKPAARYKKKEVVFHAGDIPAYAYFIVKGSVKTYKAHDDGKEFITNIHKAGDFFGHVPLFEGKPHADSALVLEESEIHKIPKEDFLALIHRNRDVAASFIKLLSNRLEEQERQLLRLAYDSVRKRTAEALLGLTRSSTDAAKAIRVTREDLASLVGTATETVIRCLGDFKEDGFIGVNGREITVLDPEGLADVQ